MVLPSPSLPRRLAALAYDTLLVLPLVMLAVAVATAALALLVGGAGARDFGATLPPTLVQGMGVGVATAFHCFFWSRGGQTLGMKAWRLRLQTPGGEVPAAGRCLARCCAAPLSLAAGGLGYLWCLWDGQGRYWHDHLSGTELALLPARRRGVDQRLPRRHHGSLTQRHREAWHEGRRPQSPSGARTTRVARRAMKSSSNQLA